MNSSRMKNRFIYFSLFIIVFSLILIIAIGQYKKYQLMHFAVENSKSISTYISNNLSEQKDVEGFHKKYNRIEGKVNSLLVSFNTVSFTVWNADGVVLQSDEKFLIGKKFSKGEHFQQAVKGKSVAAFTTLDKQENVYERQTKKVIIEVYCPLYLDGKQIAVIEFYYDVSSVESFLAKNEIYLKLIIVLLMIITMSLILRFSNLATKEIKKSEKEMNSAKEKASLLLNTTVKITSSLTIEEILTSISTSVVKYGQIQSVSVFFLDKNSSHFYLRKHSNFKSDELKKMWLSSNFSDDFILEPKDFRIETLRKHLIFQNGLSKYYSDSSGYICPIRWNEILYGIVVYEAKKKREFTEEEKSIYVGISNQLGVALRNAEFFQDVCNQANKDEMTQLYNFRFFNQKLTEIFAEGFLSPLKLSLILLDIDYFKEINDSYGHPTGDEILKQVAAILKQSGRKNDIVARYGGEEFAIILDDCSVENAFTIADRIRRSINDHKFFTNFSNFNRNITISAGIASYPMHAKDKESLIEKTDQALYLAKNSGRNKVIVYEEELLYQTN